MCRRRLMWVLSGMVLLSLLPFGQRLAYKTTQSYGHLRANRPSRPLPPSSASVAPSPAQAPGTPYRLTNSRADLDQLIHTETALLLENALVDTALPLALEVPDSLRTQGEPGAYIVQSRGPLDQAFRSLLNQAGARIVSYIPNQAYLVHASADAARALERHPRTAAVLAYEPYFKFKSLLLEAAVEGLALPANTQLKLLVFADAREQVLGELAGLEIEVVGEERSPFGPVMRVRAPVTGWTRMAQLSGVQELELVRERVLANDLSRTALGVSPNTVATSNYLDLQGSTNLLVAVVDTGVDGAHPDLAGRVVMDGSTNWVMGPDVKGHGTHVAGIIAGDGSRSGVVVSDVPGSPLPAVAGQFRGKAPQGRLYALNYQAPDSYLQEQAARTNVLISNNSWTYQANEYDLAAASYDAAVRDALPFVSGSQPLLCVFPTGNAGALNQTPLTNEPSAGYAPGTVLSPATAKNVLTVGALEQPRHVTNQVKVLFPEGEATFTPWVSSTDSATNVASFSHRGNVGRGIEGESGRFKPDLVAPGSFVISTRSGTWDEAAYYDPALQPVKAMRDSLCSLNAALAPFYRYESGSSMAAAAASGTLALMQDFFHNRLGRTNSPALMKALLINGARSVDGGLQFGSGVVTNHQGWGLLNLTNALHPALSNQTATASSVRYFDQSPSRALATAQRMTYVISVAPQARQLPLRFTLVWTDPPANPLAGVKLVNDLDLIVTNLATGAVFLGNKFAPGSSFSSSLGPGSMDSFDRVNNVENVFLAPALAGSYSVTVAAHRVNVNAVSAHSDVVQDFALVIASGNGEVPGAFSISELSTPEPRPPVSAVTNRFDPAGLDYGGFLLHQRVGAHSAFTGDRFVPLPEFDGQLTLGLASQWKFFTVRNYLGFTNAAFFTFDSRSLALPPEAANEPINPTYSAVRVADIDLYVSTDPALTNLEPAILETAERSLGRAGCEMVLLTNAVPTVYYLAVKCESHQGAEFSLGVVFTDTPFTQLQPDGSLVVRGVSGPAAIPDGAPFDQPAAISFAIVDHSFSVRRAIVTNSVSHPCATDLVGALSHNGQSVGLNRQRPMPGQSAWTWVFDDSNEQDLPGATPSDGPGNLRDFIGHDAHGVWLLTQTDTTAGQAGTNEFFGLLLEREQDLSSGISALILPGACHEHLFYVPPQATNLTVIANLADGTGPVLLEVCPLSSGNECSSVLLLPGPPGEPLVVSTTTDPPLHTGSHFLRLCNTGSDTAAVNVTAMISLSAVEPSPVVFRSEEPVRLLDDGLTTSTLYVPQSDHIMGVAVGVGIEHPRISDLAISLVSPADSRILLSENRGGLSGEGMGMFTVITNITPVSSSGGPEASTNIVNTGRTSGVITINYTFYRLPDSLRVYYEGVAIWDAPSVSGSGEWHIPYGPGTATELTVVVNEGDNYNPSTAWYYTLTSTRLDYLYVHFADDTNFASAPIKFAIPPFTNSFPVGDPLWFSNAIFYLPEQSLSRLQGENAQGAWRLEIRDTRAGATNSPPPNLVGWQLSFLFDAGVPVPTLLEHGLPHTQTVRPGNFRFFVVEVPAWANLVTNRLIVSSHPVNLLWNASSLPFGTNVPSDVTILSNVVAGSVVLATNTTPAVVPGSSYYLAVQNTNTDSADFTIQIEFDIPALRSGLPVSFDLPKGGERYFFFDAGANTTSATLGLSGLSEDADLVVRKGVPLPTLASYDYASLSPANLDESLYLDGLTAPVPLAPGRWYVGVLNSAETNVTGTLTYVESQLPPGDVIRITGYQVAGDALCLTWTAEPGRSYRVLGRVSMLESTPWTNASPVVLATSNSASWCVPLSLEFAYFLVEQVTGPDLPPPQIQLVSFSESGIRLEWLADASFSFQVQWSDACSSDAWYTFAETVTSVDGQFFYFDDGTQTGGFSGPRFYRLLRLP